MGGSALDYPWDAVKASMEREMACGNVIQQRCTCANCGSRLIVDPVNTIVQQVQCSRCDYLTDCAIYGANYSLHMRLHTAGEMDVRQEQRLVE